MRYGLLGEKLPHSFSKEIHEKLGRYTYELIEVEKENFAAFAEARDFTAINVTIPYKRDIMPYLATISEQAENIWLCVTGEEDEPRLLIFIEADDRSLAILKSCAPHAFVKNL